MTVPALRTLSALVVIVASGGVAKSSGSRRAVANDNREPAGTLRQGVLTVRLEARASEWHPLGEGERGIAVHAFAETGRPASVPGPLIRVPEGTSIHAFVRNALDTATLVVHGLSTRGGPAGADADTLQIRARETREVRFTAGAPGTYYYWGTTRGGDLAARLPDDSQLTGAFVVDPRNGAGPARRRAAADEHDRILVLSVWRRDGTADGQVTRNNVVRLAINGRTWPNTERLGYTVGDTVRFRLINASAAVHPMHLHGFYFAVDHRGDGRLDAVVAGSGDRVVTERLAVGRTASVWWVPDRSGNWLFHCHDNYHILRNPPLDGTRLPAEHTVHVRDHTRDMMGGLVMAIRVRPATAAPAAPAAEPALRRGLRLVARVDAGSTPDQPAYGYALQDAARVASAPVPLLPGPTIVLKRGEPVAITVVNELPEATAVHWHGMELESYYDGVPDFSGHPGRVARAIAPRDSFVARFTPPRSGTFIYHPHADEVRQQQAGLSGALLVVDDPAAFDPTHDHVLLVTVPRRDADGPSLVFINGSATPAPLVLRTGERYRLRIVDIHTGRPSMVARVLRDSTLVTWSPLAKDGMDVPAGAAPRPAAQQMGTGETYDFELVPDRPGELRFTVSTAAGVLLATLPVRVR
jgi:FtsP/CotA-like multicopper oxidase with cupredoxin domain